MPQATEKTYTTQVICLKTYDYGEADKILHLYSPELGRISAMAKGARRANSKLSGACELLSLTQMHLTRGRNFDVVSQYQSLDAFIGIRADIVKLAFASLYAELIHALSTEEESEDSERMFTLLQNGLRDLEACAEEDTLFTATRFQLQLMELAGFLPDFTRCMASDAPLDDNMPYYAFSAEEGGIVLPEYRHNSPGATWVNISTVTLRAFAGCLDEQRGEAASLQKQAFLQASALKTQKFLAYYYQRLLEKPVKAYGFVFQLLENA